VVSIKGGRAAGRGGRAGTATGPAGTFGPGDAPQAGHCPDRGDADRGGHGRLPDAGTTCQAIAALLAGKRDLTVVTNDFYVVTSLLDRPEIQTIHTGGVVDVSSGSSSGRLATRTIGAINIDLCFLSTGAWSVSRGVTSPALDKVELKQEVMSRSSERVLVADSTKFGPGRASASWTWSCGSRPSRSERPAAWPPDPRTVDPRAADPTNAGTRSQGTEQ